MTILFVFFVLPLATILLAIVLQKLLRNPILVGITFFAVYLIVAFTAFSGSIAAAIIGAIILSVLAFITAIIVQLICILRQRFSNNNCCRCNDRRSCCKDDDNNSVQTISDGGNLLRISCSCQNGESNDLLTINSNSNCNNNNNTQNEVAVSANIVPSSNNGGRTGCIRGCYRRL